MITAPKDPENGGPSPIPAMACGARKPSTCPCPAAHIRHASFAPAFVVVNNNRIRLYLSCHVCNIRRRRFGAITTRCARVLALVTWRYPDGVAGKQAKKLHLQLVPAQSANGVAGESAAMHGILECGDASPHWHLAPPGEHNRGSAGASHSIGRCFAALWHGPCAATPSGAEAPHSKAFG
jgi:hypothetical protein